MTHLGGSDPPGATPLRDEELHELIPSFVATRHDLDLVEQANIERAYRWLFRSQRRGDVLSTSFADALHQRMFGEVWRWAGRHRRHQTSIGVEWHRITEEMRLLFDDVAFWREANTCSLVEQAVRLHHRLVWTHPYPNGNGRHARTLANAYLFGEEQDLLPWGGALLGDPGDVRDAYLSALRRADAGDYDSLIEFALS